MKKNTTALLLIISLRSIYVQGEFKQKNLSFNMPQRLFTEGYYTAFERPFARTCVITNLV